MTGDPLEGSAVFSPLPELKAPLFCTLLLTPETVSSGEQEKGDLLTQGILQGSEWEEVIQQLQPFVKEIVIAGSPHLHPDFFEIVQAVERQRIPFHLEGSGEGYEEALGLLTRLSFLTTFRMTLPFSSPGLAAWLQEAAGSGIYLYSLSFLSEETAPCVREIACSARSQGAKGSIFARDPASRLSEESLLAALRAIQEMEEEGYCIEVEGCIPQCFFPHLWGGCLAGVASCAIDAGGDLLPCRFVPAPLGNLRKASLQRVWGGRGVRAWRKEIPLPCRRCSIQEICYARCAAQGQSGNGSLIKGSVSRTGAQSGLSLPSIDVTLQRDLCPVPQFVLRKESFGALLVRKKTILPVNRTGLSLLHSLNGRVTLEEIEQQFGEEAVQFICALYFKSFITFRREATHL